MTEQQSNSNAPAHTPEANGERRVSATIDHRFFPHIIDSIFAALSYPGLVKCASVCKEWREKARPRMFQHVALFENKNRDSNVVRSRDMDWPDLSSLLIQDSPTNTSAFSTVLGVPILDSFYEDFESGQALGPTLCWPTVFHRLLSSDNTKRGYGWLGRPDSLSGRVGWGNVVHFIDFSGDSFVFGPSCAGYPTSLTLSIDAYSDPTKPAKSISAYPEHAFSNLIDDSSDVVNSTIIFKDCRNHPCPKSWFMGGYAPHSSSQHEKDVADCRDQKLGAACELLRLICTMFYIEAITVVGLDSFLSDENVKKSYLQDVCWEVGWDTGGGIEPSIENGVPCLGDWLNFYTHDQYREKVGEERYRLETVK